MLTREQVLEAVKNGRASQCIDGRDYQRLAAFFWTKDWEALGMKLKDGASVPREPHPWTEEAVIERMKADVSFGFEKALDKRGISASLMNDVVKMWLWILEDPTEAPYAQYGLPLLKAVAVKYGFENPIGDDDGDEPKYASE